MKKTAKLTCEDYAGKFKSPYIRHWISEHMVAGYNFMSFLSVISIIFIAAVIIGVTVFIQYREQAKEDDRRAYIQLMIDAEEAILNKDVQKEPEKKPERPSAAKARG